MSMVVAADVWVFSSTSLSVRSWSSNWIKGQRLCNEPVVSNVQPLNQNSANRLQSYCADFVFLSHVALRSGYFFSIL